MYWSTLRNVQAAQKEELLQALNDIWISGVVSSALKHTVVVPIPKAGKDPAVLANLRPISLTSTICKFIERMATTRVSHHLEEEKKYFHLAQTDFRPNLSTHDSL